MQAIFRRFIFSALLVGPLLGCSEDTSVAKTDKVPTFIDSRQVAAQGKLLPATGIISLSALPGDQIDSILVKSGQQVVQGDVLIVMRSNQIRQIELQAAQTKLADAKVQEQAKKTEMRLGLEASELRLEQAKVAQQQAKQQLEIASSGTKSIDLLKAQLERLKSLRNEPQMRAMIGQSDIDLKEVELQKSEQQLQATILTAQQAVESTSIGVRLAEQARDAAQENKKLFNESKAIESLERQIELLQIQMESTRIVAPSNATVLAVMASVGETAGPTPVIEVANLSNMICTAEVHEADISRLSLGDTATISSAALPHVVTGKVIRIDTLVGSPQMRLPNPMARTDFRAVPVRIDIDPEHQAVAAKLVQLQVDVTITPARATTNTAAKPAS